MTPFDETRNRLTSLFDDLVALAEDRPILRQELRDARERLQNGLFGVVVAGEFKKGKSSLLNALLEERGLFPEGLAITTNLTTGVQFGPEERIEVYFAADGAEGVGRSRVISRADIPDYVSEDRNPARRRNRPAHFLDIRLPSDKLAGGLRLIDTPGVNSRHDAHTDLTYGAIASADAVLFVSDIETPLTTAELAVVERIERRTKNVLFVLTMADQVPDPSPIIQANREKLAPIMGFPEDEVTIIPVSSHVKWTALNLDDPDLLDESGFPQFEAVLWDYLHRTRARALQAEACAELHRAADDLDRTLTGAKGTYEARLRDDTESLGRLAAALTAQMDKVRALGARHAPWRSDLREGGRSAERRARDLFDREAAQIRDSIHNEYLYRSDVLDDPDRLLSLIEGDFDAALNHVVRGIRGDMLSLSNRLQAETSERLGELDAKALGVSAEFPGLRLTVPRTSSLWSKSLTSLTWAKFKALAGLTIGGIAGALVGLPILLGAVGMVWGWLRGARDSYQDAKAKDDETVRNALRRQIEGPLHDLEADARERVGDVVDRSMNDIRRAIEAMIAAEERTLEELKASGHAANRSSVEQAQAHVDAATAALDRLGDLWDRLGPPCEGLDEAHVFVEV